VDIRKVLEVVAAAVAQVKLEHLLVITQVGQIIKVVLVEKDPLFLMIS
jgi:hypothetical protein